LAVGTGANTAAKLTVGADGKYLKAASGEATGLIWDTPAGGIGGGTGGQIDQSGGTSDTYGVLAGARDGANVEFTVSAGAYESGSLSVYLNGQLQTQGTAEDWHEATPASGTFHFTTAPEATDEITVIYGGGNVLGPATNTANFIPQWNGADSKTLKNGLELVTTVDATGSDVKLATEQAVRELVGTGGWLALGAATYEASDDPTYTFSFASDMTTILGVGMRIKLTDSGTQYFIITAVGAYSGGKTIITGYGGTDYNLSGGAITNPYYSMVKVPYGFPLSPIKWTEKVTSVTQYGQATPTQNVWYNINAVGKISIPIGVWNVDYSVMSYVDDTGTSLMSQTTLSTANNSESDVEFTTGQELYDGDAAIIHNITTMAARDKYLSIASKTTYYLNTRTTEAGITSIYWRNAISPLIIRAVCAYL